jgi:protease-4
MADDRPRDETEDDGDGTGDRSPPDRGSAPDGTESAGGGTAGDDGRPSPGADAGVEDANAGDDTGSGDDPATSVGDETGGGAPGAAAPTDRSEITVGDRDVANGDGAVSSDRIARLLVVAGAGVVAAAVGWVLFVLPATLAGVLGSLLLVATVAVGVRLGGRIAGSRFPGYDVAEIAVEGPISRDGGPGRLPTGRVGASADEIVDLVESADDDSNAEALLLRLNTPGGEVVPSDDIRRAAAAFDGPTVAYATDACASGGYWIASGCDELWAQNATVVGSIGVIGSSANVHELAQELGVEYERYAAGKYKDAGLALKETTEDEREYLQGIVDDLYDDFVERVAEGRGLDPEFVRETEARVYLGDRALDLGLVDEVGARKDVEDRLAELLGREPSITEFEPRRPMLGRLRGGANTVAYAFGAGVGSALSPEDGVEFEFRY